MITTRYYGDYGGAYIPEILVSTFEQLVAAFEDAKADPDFWKEYQNSLVTKEMEERVKSLFEKRFNFATKDTKTYYAGAVSEFRIDKSDNYKYQIVIFPPLVWDGNIQDRHIAFKGILDWLISTINYLKQRKDINFFIRFHPAETTMFKYSDKLQNILNTANPRE